MSYTLRRATVVHETERAVLVESDDLDASVWVPKSAVHDDSEVWRPGQEPGDLVIHDWFAEKEGWV